MGIDVYMHWEGQEQRDLDAGYLRESYGAPAYATHILVPEAFDEQHGHGWLGAPIPSDILANRLGAAFHAARLRYPDDSDRAERHMASIVDFVMLAQRKERETGQPVRIKASW